MSSIDHGKVSLKRMNASWNNSLSKNQILSCDEYSHRINWKESIDFAWISSNSFDSHWRFRYQRRQNHWRWHNLTRQIVPISITGVMPFWPLANPRNTRLLVSQARLDRPRTRFCFGSCYPGNGFRNHFLQPDKNQTKPLTLPFADGFLFRGKQPSCFSEMRGFAKIKLSTLFQFGHGVPKQKYFPKFSCIITTWPFPPKHATRLARPLLSWRGKK